MKAFSNQFKFGVGRNEGRRKQHMVARAAIYGSAHGVHHQATRHGFALDSCVKPQG